MALLKRPLLLAPVSGPSSLIPALASGADAVYLGLKQFNARQKAENFTVQELGEAVETCNRAGCRVFLTFNTLVLEREWRRALELLAAAYAAGVHALIVQDLGVMETVRSRLPDLPLHASTQMTVHHPSQLPFLADAGFEQVILARELTLDEVRVMAEEARRLGMGVEVFAHGALCVSYSGQCLISAFMEGRSGNRGLCAQVCRRPFRVVSDGKRGQRSLPLSMKDLSALSLLPELVKIGVACLKVEGRLKRPEYMAAVIGIYKEALDRIDRGDASFPVDLEEQLHGVFNRGFTTGGLGDAFIAEETTGRFGGARFQRLGFVTRLDRRRARLYGRFERTPEPGDGVALFADGDKAPFASIVTRVSLGGDWIGVTSVRGCPDQGDLFLSSSASKMKAINDRISAFRLPKIGLRLSLEGAEGAPLVVEARAASGLLIKTESRRSLKRAGKRPLSKEVLKEQLGRLGGTPYALKALETKGLDDLFLPLSELNDLRRRVIEELEQKRTAARTVPAGFFDAHEQGVLKATKTKISVLCQAEKAKAALRAGADRLILPADGPMDTDLRAWLLVPAITPFKWFEDLKARIKRGTWEGIVAGHMGAAKLAAEADLPFWADTSFNVVNGRALARLQKAGALGATLSWELKPEHLLSLCERAGLPVEIPLLGRPPLMETALKNLGAGKGLLYLLDDEGRSYPARRGEGGGYRIEAPFFRAGIDLVPRLAGRAEFIRLDLRAVPFEDSEAVVRAFKKVLDDPLRLDEARRCLAGRFDLNAGWVGEGSHE